MADPTTDPRSSGDPHGADVPRVLCDLGALSAAAESAGADGANGAHDADGSDEGAAAPAGALWRLTEPGRQLDANLVHLPPDARVEAHTESDLDVLLAVVAGGGTLGGAPAPQPLAPGSLVWLPHGAARSLAAGAAGLSYLTVHRRRPGMKIGRRTDT
ncbi:hypothetical protein [Streptomyces sp. CA2R106]|uniref:hypothetical protein n=1 Tax=Streptomyces sp. CA2R106 TaxID=3120153 RepID=UPI0030085A08